MSRREFDLFPAAKARPAAARRAEEPATASVETPVRSLSSALLQLQRAYGNRYVQRVVEQARTEPVSQDGPVDALVQQAIRGTRGRGQPLPERIRGPFERAFGADFAGVRLHADVQADRLSEALQAQAFTTGQDIFFRRGEYDPGSTRGQQTLAHELTHVVQQRGRPMGVQCLRRRATMKVNANLRQDGEVMQRVLMGTGITIELDSAETRPDGHRYYQLTKVNGKDVSDRGWWLRRDWFHLPPRKRRTPKDRAAAPSGTEYILPLDLLQGGSGQVVQQSSSKYVHNLVVQFGSPLDAKIQGGSWDLVDKLNKLAPYKLAKEQKENLPQLRNANVVSVERESRNGPIDPQAVKDVTNALRTLATASKFGPVRLYLRGHGDIPPPLPQSR